MGLSSDELAAILRNVDDGITAQGPDGALVYANDAAARLCGLDTAEELLSLSGAELFERFEIVGEDGEPLPLGELPNRRVLASHAPEEGVLGYRVRATGAEHWSVLRSAPVLAPDGELQLVINVFHDITEQRLAEARLRFLAEASEILSASLDYKAMLGDLARLLVPRLADRCAIELLDADGGVQEVAISHGDARTALPPALAVPLEARGRVLGTLSLGMEESGRELTTADVEIAHEIARRAALAVDNASLFGAAQESYARLDTLLVSAPVGIGFWDQELRFVRVNQALADLNKRTPEEHVGRSLGEVIPSLAPHLEPLYRRVLETGRPVVHEESTNETLTGPGDARHWLSSYYPVRTESGETTGIGGMIMEITGQRRADARLRLLAEAGELFSSSLDPEEIFRRISRVVVPRIADACNIYLAEGTMLTRVAHAHADPELERLMDAMPEIYDIGSTAPPLFREIFESGESLLASTLSGEVVDALEALGVDREAFARVGSRSMMFVPFVSRGKTLGVLTLGSREAGRYGDADLELAGELARRASVALDNARLVGELQRRAQAAQALEFVGDGVFLVGSDGVVRLWNPAAARITGLAETAVAGKPAALALAGWPLEQARERPQTFPVESARGERWLSLTAARFPDGTVYAFRDLTEERAVEQHKSDFVATVSHELRTPLAAIYGAAMTLQREDVTLDAEQQAGMLSVIAGESERLARIVNDILFASRLDSGAEIVSIGRADPLELARGILAAAETHLPPGVELVLAAPWQGSRPGPQVAADPDALRQVLVNLVENAVKYSPSGGRVELRLEEAGGRVRFSVRDDGLGIPRSEHERIFEKFFRLDPNLSRGVGGTGLGLYICRELVQRMGGRLRVQSEPDRGSTFSFELPRA